MFMFFSAIGHALIMPLPPPRGSRPVFDHNCGDLTNAAGRVTQMNLTMEGSFNQ